jgi:prephenate dehydrogenase
MKVTVIGLGLMGGSLALDLKARGFASSVTGVDLSAAHQVKALSLKLVDRVASLENAVKDAELVILAIPVNAIASALPQVMSLANPNAAITDMGSTKEKICRSVEGHPLRARFVASHPMAGTENSGPEAALTGLFDHKTAVICDGEKSSAQHLDRVEKMYAALKMRVIRMTSVEHDRHAAFVSHLSHISSFVLASTVLKEENSGSAIFDMAGGGFESTVRLAKSSPAMWGPIFEQNHGNVLAAIESYIAHLETFRQALISNDTQKTSALMEDANRIRRVLDDMGSRMKKRVGS